MGRAEAVVWPFGSQVDRERERESSLSGHLMEEEGNSIEATILAWRWARANNNGVSNAMSSIWPDASADSPLETRRMDRLSGDEQEDGQVGMDGGCNTLRRVRS